MRVDPTDTGGLFIGRRPGTRPVRYRRAPERPGGLRRRADGLVALVLLATMAAVCLSFWGPLPAGWLWIGSHVQWWTGSVSAGILSAFVGLLASLLLGLVVLRRLDQAWILVRRAAGHDQRRGPMTLVFATTCAVGALAFTVWLLLFSGATLAPLGIEGL